MKIYTIRYRDSKDGKVKYAEVAAKNYTEAIKKFRSSHRLDELLGFTTKEQR